jgi:hypothetical protein
MQINHVAFAAKVALLLSAIVLAIDFIFYEISQQH